MRVVMTLSLDNLASGPLGKFMAQLEALQQATAEVNGEFAAVGKSSQGAAAAMETAAQTGTEAMGTVAGAAAEAADAVTGVSTAMMNRWRQAMTAIAAATSAGADESGASFAGVGESASSVNRYMVARWQRGMDAMAASTAAATEAIEGQLNAWGRTAAEETARVNAMIDETMAKIEASRGAGALPIAAAATPFATQEAYMGARGNAAGQMADMATLQGAMNRTAASAEDLAAQEQAVDRLMSAGMISSEEYGAALDALNAEEAALGLGIESTTVAVEEQNVAMKSASGQAFRFRGLYGTISEGLNFMMTPLGLLTAGLVGVGGAALYGAYESDKFNDAIIATGGAAGLSAGELDAMARNISSSGIPLRVAQAALLAVAQSGKLMGATLEKAGRLAAQMASLTGESVKQAATQIESLATDPAKSVAKLNDQFHFLTVSQYKTIAALQETGQTAKATALAITDFSNVMAARMQEAARSTTPLMKALNSLEWGVNRLLADMEKLGQPTSLTQKFQKDQSYLDWAAQQGLVKSVIQTGPNGRYAGWAVTAAGAKERLGGGHTIQDVINQQNQYRTELGIQTHARATHAAALQKSASIIDVLAGASGKHPHAAHAAHLKAIHDTTIKSDTWMNSVFGAAGTALNHHLGHYQTALAAVTRNTNPMQAIRDKYAGYAATLSGWGNSSGAQSAVAAGNTAANKEGYKLSMQKLAALQHQLAAEEKLIAVRKQTGSITPLQAQQQDIAAQKGIAPQMERAASAAMKYAHALNNKELVASLKAQLAQIKAMGTQLNQVQQGITRSFQSGMQGFLQQFMQGTTTWRNMLIGLNNSILTGINHTIAQSLAQSITGSGKNSGAGQGFLSLFGGGGSSGSSGGGSSWLNSIGGWIASTFMGNSFAVGTASVPHDMVAQIHAGERIIPAATNQRLTEMLSSGSLGGHQINLSIHAMDSQSVLGAMSGISRELAQMISGTNAAYNLGT